MCQNKMCLNLTTNKAMVFGTNYMVYKITNTIDDNTIELINKYKYLGIILYKTLTFNEHVTYLKSKIVDRTKTLSRLCPLVGADTTFRLYRSLVMPVLDYADVIYDCLSAKLC